MSIRAILEKWGSWLEDEYTTDYLSELLSDLGRFVVAARADERRKILTKFNELFPVARDKKYKKCITDNAYRHLVGSALYEFAKYLEEAAQR